MNLFLEAVCVGLYAVLLGFLVPFKTNLPVFLFFLGVVKHMTSYYYGLQTYYCNHGQACKKVKDKDKDKPPQRYSADMSFSDLLMQSVLEGCLFLFVGYLLHMRIGNLSLLSFCIAFVLHLLFEWLGVHGYFCNHSCALETVTIQ